MKAEYKSAVRSRRMIRDAFFALAEEKDIRTITVTDLIRQAVIEKIEDEIDLAVYNKAAKEFKKNPKTYSLDEVEKELGL